MTLQTASPPRRSPYGTDIRWMIRADMEAVLAIERASFAQPWAESDFIHSLRQRNCIGMVAMRDGQVVGSMVYELHSRELRLLNLAVDPRHRRRGIGSLLAAKLATKLTERRRRIVLDTCEANLAAHLFWRALGFRCVGIVAGGYGECGPDTYTFELRATSCAVRDRP